MLGAMRRALLIINPRASGVTEVATYKVRTTLLTNVALEVVETERKGHATEVARAADRVEAIFVFSGDGVYNEVLNGLETDVPLGFVPGGGTSVLPRALGLGRDPVRVAHRLVDSLEHRRTRRISLGRVNGRRFGFSAGIGLDAEVVRRVDALGRSLEGRRPGDVSFVATLASSLSDRRWRLEPQLEVRGLGRAALAIVSNTRVYTYVGPRALSATSRARFELGLDVAAPRAAGRGHLTSLLVRLLFGHGFEGSADVLTGHDLDRIEIACDAPMPLQVDGEDMGDVREAVFEAEREAVQVLI
jgi:diacylglycerol kinase family enzyme